MWFYRQQQWRILKFVCAVTGSHKVLALHKQCAHCIHPKSLQWNILSQSEVDHSYQNWTMCECRQEIHATWIFQWKVSVICAWHVHSQEYIIDKSMKPRIPTVNGFLRKWRSETPHVGKVTILLFQRNAWILLHVLAPCDSVHYVGILI